MNRYMKNPYAHTGNLFSSPDPGYSLSASVVSGQEIFLVKSKTKRDSPDLGFC